MIPKSETIWLQHCQDGKATHIITSTVLRDYYYLYEMINDKPVKTKHKAENPLDLDKWIIKE